MEATPHQLFKMQIWEEMGPEHARVCVYSGEILSLARVLSEEVEVEHILPWSQTLDDSRGNKILSYRHANREKRNRSPFDAWGHDKQRYAEILKRVDNLPDYKQWRFMPDAMERFAKNDGFLDRQLNDTRYLARIARDYLQHLYDADQAAQLVRVVPGQLTALLRHAWGLNHLLGSDANEKSRTDHRHHLIDAAVVGMTDRRILQQMAQQASQKQEKEDIQSARRALAKAERPYNAYFDELRDMVEDCIVWHRPDHFTPPKRRHHRCLA